MTWPTSVSFDDSVLGATTDLVHLARPEILALMQDVADMIEARAAADGVASLGNDGLIPTAQLPVVPVSKGGTGATNAQQARANLGLTPYDGTTPESAGPFTLSHPSTMELLTLESTADNTSGIVMSVNRLRPAGANDDVAFVLGVQANDEAGGTALVSTISTSLVDASEAAMTSRIVMQTMQAGTLADRMLIDGDTVRVLGKLAGGSSGAAGSPAANELLWGGPITTSDHMSAGTGSIGVSAIESGFSATPKMQILGPLALGGTGTHGDIMFGTNLSKQAARINVGSDDLFLRFFTNTSGSGLTEKMRITRTGAVGIGAGGVSPSARLHVIDTTEQLRLGYDTNNYASFTVGSTGNLAVAPTGTNTTISGTLGVGGTYDDGRLHVLGSNSGDLVVAKLENSSNGPSAITRLLMELGTGGVTANIALGYSSSSYMRFGLGPAGEHMRLTSGGLGIGTGAHPSAKLHVVSTTEQLRVGYDTNNYFKLNVASDGAAILGAQGTDADFTISTSTTSLFMDASGDTIRLDASTIYHDAYAHYFRYDSSNYLRIFTSQSDGEVRLITVGSDPDMLLTTQNIQYAIYIDDSAGSVGFGTDEPDSSTVAHFNGKVLVDGDLTVTGLIGGSRMVLTASYAASQAVSSASPGLMLLGDVQIGGGGAGSQGFVAHRSGSIVGISIIYGVTTENGPLAMFSSINGTLKSSTDISSTVGSVKKATATFSRGTYTFSAGDVIRWGIRVKSGSPTTVENVICSLEIIYD